MQILDNPVLDPTHGSDISDPLQGTDPPDDESLNAQTKWVINRIYYDYALISDLEQWFKLPIFRSCENKATL